MTAVAGNIVGACGGGPWCALWDERSVIELTAFTGIASIRDDGQRYAAQVAALARGERLVLADPIASFEQLWEPAVGAA
jgi:hypothetical protein